MKQLLYILFRKCVLPFFLLTSGWAFGQSCPDTIYSLCPGVDSYTLTTQSGLTNIQWQISHDSLSWTNLTGATGASYVVQDTGWFRYIALDSSGCSVELCCPFRFEALDCNVAVGNLVWNDANYNGTQDPGELGIPNVTVELFAAGDDPATDTPIATVTTDANGVYYFDNLPPGSYFVHIPAENFIAGAPLHNMVSCLPDGNDETTDSDDNGANAGQAGGISSNTFTLTANAEPTGEANQGTTYTGTLDDNNVNSTIDFSFGPARVAIGNTIFMDTDGSGSFNAGDMPISGVVVQLYAATANPGVDAPLFTTTTNANGNYIFDNLTPGQYIVYIPASQFAVGGPLHGKQSSAPQGGDTATDENADENGQNTPVNGGIASGVINLQPGTEPTSEPSSTYTGSLPDANVNETVDFGFAPIPPGCLPVICLPVTVRKN